jgi:hypothetical protein
VTEHDEWESDDDLEWDDPEQRDAEALRLKAILETLRKYDVDSIADLNAKLGHGEALRAMKAKLRELTG